jgi:hypothetical protein
MKKRFIIVFMHFPVICYTLYLLVFFLIYNYALHISVISFNQFLFLLFIESFLTIGLIYSTICIQKIAKKNYAIVPILLIILELLDLVTTFYDRTINNFSFYHALLVESTKTSQAILHSDFPIPGIVIYICLSKITFVLSSYSLIMYSIICLKKTRKFKLINDYFSIQYTISTIIISFIIFIFPWSNEEKIKFRPINYFLLYYFSFILGFALLIKLVVIPFVLLNNIGCIYHLNTIVKVSMDAYKVYSTINNIYLITCLLLPIAIYFIYKKTKKI